MEFHAFLRVSGVQRTESGCLVVFADPSDPRYCIGEMLGSCEDIGGIFGIDPTSLIGKKLRFNFGTRDIPVDDQGYISDSHLNFSDLFVTAILNVISRSLPLGQPLSVDTVSKECIVMSTDRRSMLAGLGDVHFRRTNPIVERPNGGLMYVGVQKSTIQFSLSTVSISVDQIELWMSKKLAVIKGVEVVE